MAHSAFVPLVAAHGRSGKGGVEKRMNKKSVFVIRSLRNLRLCVKAKGRQKAAYVDVLPARVRGRGW